MMSLTFASVLNKPKIARVLGIPEKIEHPEDPKAAKDQVWVSSACQSVKDLKLLRLYLAVVYVFDITRDL